MAHAASHNEQNTKDLLALVTIQPRKMERLDLGEYESEELIPRLIYKLTPEEPESLAANEAVIEQQGGGLRLALHLENYSDHAVTVRVLEAR